MRLVIRKSALLELAKGLDGDSFEKIKAEIIARLKGLENQENEPELAKAAEQLNSDEYMFSHLEKSLGGEWIEKAGYGIGTVRTWRGKKYKKIAQGKWARVYDKIDRGAKNAMTRLVHQAESIDTPEEMMRFVLANKQRFSDANGKPLDIVDRLNAVIDGKTYAGKEASKQTEQKPESRLSERQQKKQGYTSKLRTELKQNLKESLGLHKNKKTGIEANLSGKSVDKMSSDKAIEKSKVNGFSVDEHFEVANKIVELYENADLVETSPDKNGSANLLSIKRFDCSVKLSNGKEAIAHITVKESRQDGHKIYSVEVMDLEQKKSRSQTNGAGVGLSQKTGTQSADSNIPQSGGKSSRFAPSDSADIEKKEVIAEPVSQSDGNVEFPKTKETKTEFEQLAKCVSKDKNRYFMTGVYYDKEKGVLVSTDARRLKFVKVGDLTGFDKSGYVNIDTNGKNIAITRNDAMPEYAKFPNYKKVIPDDSAMKIRANLDNKVLAEKIKAMKADGSVSKRNGKGELDTIRIDFEKNGNVMLDGTKIGSTGKQDNDLPPLYMNVHYLTDAISAGKTSVLSLQEPKADEFLRAMTMNTGCSTSVIMPQGAADKNVDYEARRAEAKYEKDKKDKASTFKKEDFKSMSDAELKDYEAKLEKELLASKRGEPDYSEKYSHWQEVHQENDDRFHQHLADEAKAEKQREEEIKAEKEKEIKEKYNGYFDNRKGLERARAIKSLEKKYRFEGKVMSNKEFVEQAIDNGTEIKEHEVNKLDYPSRVRWNRMNGYEQEQYEKRIKAAGKKTVYTIGGYEFPKDVVDYAKFYKEGKSSRLKEMQKRGLSTQVKKSDSLYDYVQKSIAALRACRAI